MFSPVADLGVGDQALGPELAAEQGAAELVEQDLALGDIAGRDQGVQDDACLPAIHQVVILVAEHGATIAHGHRCGVGVGPADFPARDPLVRAGSRALRIEPALLQ